MPLDSAPPRPDFAKSARFWPQGWWRCLEIRLGIIPLPIVFVVLGLTAYFVHAGRLPGEICMMIAVIATGGFLFAEIGKRIPGLRSIGGGALVTAFLPPALQYYGILPAVLIRPIAEFTRSTMFLYLFIAAVIGGSILSMDRRILVRGFAKIFVPLAAGAILAALVGTLVGTLLGLGTRHTLLFVVVPVMAGGLGEGAIPLSAGYSTLMHRSAGEILAAILPVVLLANFCAVSFAGLLHYWAKTRPHLSGQGRLQPGGIETIEPAQAEEIAPHLDVESVAAAGLFVLSLYLVGLFTKEVWGFPAPVAMLFLAVLAKLTDAVPASLLAGVHLVYRFFRVAVTYPLLFAVSVTMTPWDQLISAFTLPTFVTIVATVTTLVATGFTVARWVNLYPIETAIVSACQSGMGGTGDVAILTAANRMQLMPFAQIATRIGGAINVTLTLLLLRALS